MSKIPLAVGDIVEVARTGIDYMDEFNVNVIGKRGKITQIKPKDRSPYQVRLDEDKLYYWFRDWELKPIVYSK